MLINSKVFKILFQDLFFISWFLDNSASASAIFCFNFQLTTLNNNFHQFFQKPQDNLNSDPPTVTSTSSLGTHERTDNKSHYQILFVSTISLVFESNFGAYSINISFSRFCC